MYSDFIGACFLAMLAGYECGNLENFTPIARLRRYGANTFFNGRSDDNRGLLAVALAALKAANYIWMGIVTSLVYVILLFATLNCIFSGGITRRFWGGFALFGWAYLFAIYVPWLHNNLLVGITLSEHLLEWLYSKLHDTSGSPNLMTQDAFRRIGHFLSALFGGFIGGIIARHIVCRPERDMRQLSSPENE